MRTRILTLTCFLLTGLIGPVSAQAVYWSITGPGGPVRLSGDTTQRYEFWVRPDKGADTAVIEVFDASLGGTADIVQGNSAMATRFRVFDFDELYTSPDLPLQRTAGNPTPRAELLARDEPRMLNRWTTLAMVEGRGKTNGWIVIVDVSDGNDVNAYKLDVRDPRTGRSVWNIAAFDLPLCLYAVTAGNEVQVRSLAGSWGSVPPLVIAGAEGAPIRLRNDEGDERSARGGTARTALAASWGIAVEGSPGAINNLVIASGNGSALWDARPVLTQVPRRPGTSVLVLPGNDCLNLRFVLAGSRTAPGMDSPRWRYADRSFTGDTISVTFADYGNKTLDVLVPTRSAALPRFWREPVSARVSPPPRAVIAANRTVAGPSDPVILSTDGSVDPAGRRVTFRWSVNGAPRGTGRQLRLEGLVPGLYSVRLDMQADDPIGACASAFAEQEIRINGQPYAEIEGRASAGTDVSMTFRAARTNDVDNDALIYTWTGSAIRGSLSGPSIDLTHASPGTYTLSLNVNDGTSTGNATYTTTFRYRINAAPVVTFTLPERVAPGTAVQLNGRAVSDPDRDNLVYQWRTSDGQEFSGRDAAVTWPDSGNVVVRLTVDDGQGVENSIRMFERTIRVSPPVLPRIGGLARSNEALQQFSAAGTVVPDPRQVRYSWAFGDGATATGERVSHRYQRPGTYTVRLRTDDGLGLANSVQTVEHALTINAYPTAVIDAPAIWEPGRPLRFSGARSTDPDGSVAAYAWFLDGMPVSTAAEDSVVLRAAGEHTLTLQVTDDSGLDGAVAVATHAVRANTPPDARFTVTPAAAAPEQSVAFDASSSSDADGTRLRSFSWTFDDGQVFSGTKITRTFSQTGIAGFTLRADDEQGMSNSAASVRGTILVNNPPIIVTQRALRVTSQRVHLDASESYDPDGDALRISWTLPDGSVITGSSVTWQSPERGVQFVTVSADDGRGLRNSVTRETARIIINRPPVAVVDTIIFSCSGRPVLFSTARCTDPDGDPILASWDFGDGTTSTESNPVHTYAASGIYAVTVTLSDGFADEPVIARIPVIIEDSPTAVMNLSDTTICTGMSLGFSGERSIDPSGAIVSYAWDFGNGTTAAGPKVSTSYIKPGTYSVSLTVTGSGSGQCPRTHQTTATVRVVAGPVAAFTVPAIVSPGDVVSLDGGASTLNGQLDMARWIITGPDSSITRDGMTGTFVASTPGEYSVRLDIRILSGTNCNSASVTRVVRVIAPPSATIAGPSSVPIGSAASFDARGSKDPDGIIVSYAWSVDGRPAGSGPVLSQVFTANGEHTVRLETRDNSGTASSGATADARVFANAAPRARFAVPPRLFEGERLSLTATETVDADGDRLSLSWTVDGSRVTADAFTPSPGQHSILLRADDGRGLPNSVDSLVQEVFVTPAPSLEVTCPRDWAAGSRFDLRAYVADTTIILTDRSDPSVLTLSDRPGDATLATAWAPRGTPLRTGNIALRIWEPLAFTASGDSRTVVWNPANPRTVLTAPAVNRPADRGITYEWFRGGKPAGRGPRVEVTLQRGENVFVVRALDRGIEGSKPVETVVRVTTD